MIDHIDIFTPN